MDSPKEFPIEQPMADFWENVHKRLADKTFGYAICSVTATWLLVLMPQFYAVYAELAKSQPTVGIIDVFNLMWAGGIVVFLLTIGFLIGGLALYHSLSWARTFLAYLFTLWGLIILWEIRYSLQRQGLKLPDARGMIHLLIIIAAVIFLGLVYFAYQKKNLLTIRIMALINVVFTLWNFYLVIAVFIRGHAAYLPNRQIEYCSLVFLAVVISQAVICGKEFIPALWRR